MYCHFIFKERTEEMSLCVSKVNVHNFLQLAVLRNVVGCVVSGTAFTTEPIRVLRLVFPSFFTPSCPGS